MWSTFDLQSFDERLNVRYEVTGAAVELQNLNWNSRQDGPEAMLTMGFEVVNPGNEPLEITAISITLRNAMGQEHQFSAASLEDYYWGNILQGHVLLGNDTRPETAQVRLHPAGVPLPLLWTEALIKLQVRPALAEGLALYWRSQAVEVAEAGYVDARTYRLRGHVADFMDFAERFRAERKGRLNVQAVVSLYGGDGRLLGGFGIPVSTFNNGDFEMTLAWPDTEEENRIADYRLWFAELRP